MSVNFEERKRKIVAEVRSHCDNIKTLGYPYTEGDLFYIRGEALKILACVEFWSQTPPSQSTQQEE